MVNKRLKPESIASKWLQLEVLLGRCLSRLDKISRIGIGLETPVPSMACFRHDMPNGDVFYSIR